MIILLNYITAAGKKQSVLATGGDTKESIK
jgi:hypothetical protein